MAQKKHQKTTDMFHRMEFPVLVKRNVMFAILWLLSFSFVLFHASMAIIIIIIIIINHNKFTSGK